MAVKRPLADFFKGHGGAVFQDMVKLNHGNEGMAEREFYATVNKMRQGTKAQRGAQPKRAPGANP